MTKTKKIEETVTKEKPPTQKPLGLTSPVPNGQQTQIYQQAETWSDAYPEDQNDDEKDEDPPKSSKAVDNANKKKSMKPGRASLTWALQELEAQEFFVFRNRAITYCMVEGCSGSAHGILGLNCNKPSEKTLLVCQYHQELFTCYCNLSVTSQLTSTTAQLRVKLKETKVPCIPNGTQPKILKRYKLKTQESSPKQDKKNVINDVFSFINNHIKGQNKGDDKLRKEVRELKRRSNEYAEDIGKLKRSRLVREF